MRHARPCPSWFCPGCGALRCVCPPPEHDDALAEAAYQLGHEHGAADGPEHRPARAWLSAAGLDAGPYLTGYDEACAGVQPTSYLAPVGHDSGHDHGHGRCPDEAPPARDWTPSDEDLDDGLPF